MHGRQFAGRIGAQLLGEQCPALLEDRECVGGTSDRCQRPHQLCPQPFP